MATSNAFPVLSVRSCGYCHQNLKEVPTVRKLNIVDIVLQLSRWRICVEITIPTSLNAIWDMNIKRERHDGYSIC